MEKGLTKMRPGQKAFLSKHTLLMSGTNVEFSVHFVYFITLILYSEKLSAFINKKWETIIHGVEKTCSKFLNFADQNIRGIV